MTETRGSRGEWLGVPCPDGSTVRILKNSDDAFKIDAEDWANEVTNTIDILEKIRKEEKNPGIDNNIESILASIHEVDDKFRELYIKSYSMFAAQPCDAALRKQRDEMEIAISSAVPYLQRIQRALQMEGADKFNDIILKIIPEFREETDEHIIIPAIVNRGVELSSSGKHQEALTIYDRALELIPEHGQILYNKGIALSRLGRYREARKFFDKALDLDPKYDNAMYEKGLTYFKESNYKDALDCYDQASTINPNNI